MILTTIVNGVYKPTYNWGAPHCSIWGLCLQPIDGYFGDGFFVGFTT